MARGNKKSRVANRIRKARAKLNRSKRREKKVDVRSMSEQQHNKKELLIPGQDIECRGSRSYYPKAVYFYMRKHCLACRLSFHTISDQIRHMDEHMEHDDHVVCKRCYQAFPEGTDVRAPHVSLVPFNLRRSF